MKINIKRWLYLYVWCRYLYRPVMRFSHRYNWHYMPLSYPERDTIAWCHWCGIRYTIKRGIQKDINISTQPNNEAKAESK